MTSTTGQGGGETVSMSFHAHVPSAHRLPQHILVAPFGEVASANGAFVVDADAMQATIEAFVKHGTDLPIDFEHQSLGGPYSAPSGLAPAAGWIKALRAVLPEEGVSGTGGGAAEGAVSAAGGLAAGLWADVEWTPLAVEQLGRRQYRYLSPVALVRKGDRRMIELHSVALTNKPAIVGMRPVVAKTAMPGADASAMERLRVLLAMPVDADTGQLLASAAQRIDALQQEVAAEAATRCVERACAAGKLAAGQREWAFGLALRDPAGFEAWLEAAPTVVTLGCTAAPVGDVREHTAAAAERLARSEYRANAAFLGVLCSEDAYVADAVRSAR